MPNVTVSGGAGSCETDRGDPDKLSHSVAARIALQLEVDAYREMAEAEHTLFQEATHAKEGLYNAAVALWQNARKQRQEHSRKST